MIPLCTKDRLMIQNKWGYEEIIVQTDSYEGSKKVIFEGYSTDFIDIGNGEKVVYVNDGFLKIEFVDQPSLNAMTNSFHCSEEALFQKWEHIPYHYLKKGKSFCILPNTRYRLTAIEETTLFEFFSHKEKKSAS